MQQITLLGATGSIGQQTLAVIALHPERFRVLALTAYSDVTGLLQQCQRFKPRYAVLVDDASAQQLAMQVRTAGLTTEVLSGNAALSEIAGLDAADYVVAGIVGAAGLLPTLAAVRAGKKVLIANKEPLVMAGELFMTAVREAQATLLPIDSEHNAIFQCLPSCSVTGATPVGINKVILTASGGALRHLPLNALADVTPAQACAHPNWNMGDKITIDCATMLNKGFEVIEAHHLFALPLAKIDVILHPQSIVHSLVEYIDGSLLAQLGSPDMRIPIANALAWPQRIHSGAQLLNLLQVAQLDFQPICEQRYPAFRLALQAAAQGGTTPAILNAANEVAVQAFLQQRIAYPQIYHLLQEVLANMPTRAGTDLDSILDSDQQTRRVAHATIDAWAT